MQPHTRARIPHPGVDALVSILDRELAGAIQAQMEVGRRVARSHPTARTARPEGRPRTRDCARSAGRRRARVVNNNTGDTAQCRVLVSMNPPRQLTCIARRHSTAKATRSSTLARMLPHSVWNVTTSTATSIRPCHSRVTVWHQLRHGANARRAPDSLGCGASCTAPTPRRFAAARMPDPRCRVVVVRRPRYTAEQGWQGKRAC